MHTMIQESELVLASDGSLYHIHLTGDMLADNVMLVGDPERVDMFKDIFDSIEIERSNREIHALTGTYHGQRFTALSTGMGTDNIDIVLTELDAAANINLATRSEKRTHRTLRLVRIGTCGSLHSEIACGSVVASAYAIGLDGLLNYYRHDNTLMENAMQQQLIQHLQLPVTMATPYCVRGSEQLQQQIGHHMTHGITATAPGFYAPQGRHVRLAPALTDLNERLTTFSWDGLPVTNLEMETSAIYGLARLMGHEALTVCLVIANRADGTFLNEYHNTMRTTIATVMERLAQQ